MRLEVDFNARCQAEGMSVEWGPQRCGWMLLLHTLNLLLVHLYAYFHQLLQYFLLLSRPYIETT